MEGITLIGGALIGKAQGAFVDSLWNKLSDSVRARLVLPKDKLKKAMEVALIYALDRTVQKHLYFDSDLFLGNLFERPDTELVDRLLSRENYPTAEELAQAWAKNLANTPDSERAQYAKAMVPQCETFLQEFRRALRHTRLLQSDPIFASLLALDAVDEGSTATIATTPNIAQLEQQLAGWVENVTDAYQNLSATLSQWMQRRWSGGLNRLPTDYTSELQNFLYEYLGGPGRTVPFGGRQSDLDFLTGWLDDPYKPQRLLIAAEAGRGKSALLTRWCSQLQLRGDIHIVFIPISLRFGTAAPEIYFGMLAARLAVIRGETIQHTQLNAAQWKGVCNSYLAQLSNDERVFIVLDGLDESIDPHVIDKSLIPRSLPKGVKVVVSARTQTDKNEAEWLRTLGWDIGNLGRSTTLLPLSEKGVRDVLEAMGNPLDHLAERDVVIQALYRLTEGDPLLVGLYVDALAAKGGQVAYITLEELGQITPGLEGYFDQWWEDQQKQWEAKGANPLTKPEVEDFFYTLATARGPITKAELQQVLESITAPRLTHMAQEVKRFIVGDGTESGYAFSHPRLGYYFLDQLSETDKVQKHKKYVEYGEHVLQGLKTTPASIIAQTHPYILQHYLQHLAHTSAPIDKFYNLLCREWAEAWFALRGTYDGFLADVDRIWEQAREDTRTGKRVRGMANEILCALCQSSIVAMSSNVSAELLASATKTGIYTPTQAFALIRQMEIDEQKASSIQALLNATNVNDFLRQEILELSRSIQSFSLRASVLIDIAVLSEGQTRHALIQEALEMARSIQDASARASALTEVAEQVEGEKRFALLQEALTATRSIQNEPYLSHTLLVISRLLPLDHALEVIRSIKQDFARTHALSDLAERVEGETRHTIIQEALKVAHSIEDTSHRAQALSAIAERAEGETRHAIIQEALKVAHSIEDTSSRAQALSAIAERAEGETRHAIIQEALKVAHSIEDTSSRAYALRAISRLLPLDQALEVSSSIDVPSYRASALNDIAERVDGKTRIALIETALEISRALKDESKCVRTLWVVAEQLEGAQNITLMREILEIARSIEEPAARASALQTLAEHSAGETRYALFQEALEATRSIPYEFKRVTALRAIAPLLPLDQGLEVARSIHVAFLHASALSDIAKQLVGADQLVLLKEAWAIARSIPDPSSRVYSLRSIAEQSEGEMRFVLLQEAWEEAQLIEEPSSRVHVLRAITNQSEGTARHTRMQEELNVARLIPYHFYRTYVLSDIAARSEGATRLALIQEALEVARSIQEASVRVSALCAIMERLEEETRLPILEEVLEVARSIEEPSARASTLTAIAKHSEGETHFTLIQEALEAIHSIKIDYHRVTMLRAIAPLLPLDQALDLVRSITFTLPHASALHTIMQLCNSLTFSSFPDSTLLQAWQKSIQHSAGFSRSAFLKDLTILLPLTFFLSENGTPARTEETIEPSPTKTKPSTRLATEIAKSIQDVCSWWP